MDEPGPENVDSGDPTARPALLRAIVAADSELVGEGLRSLLRSANVDVVALARSGGEAVRQAQASAPDLIFVEDALLGGEAPALGALRDVAAGTAMIVLGCHGEPANVGQALALGAQGYLCQDISACSLLFATQVALQGLVLLDRPALRELSRTLEAAPPAGYRGLAPAMTGREWQVLELLARGMGNRAIAREMAVGMGTVRSHVCRIVRKLAVANREEAIAWAGRHGLGRT